MKKVIYEWLFKLLRRWVKCVCEYEYTSNGNVLIHLLFAIGDVKLLTFEYHEQNRFLKERQKGSNPLSRFLSNSLTVLDFNLARMPYSLRALGADYIEEIICTSKKIHADAMRALFDYPVEQAQGVLYGRHVPSTWLLTELAKVAFWQLPPTSPVGEADVMVLSASRRNSPYRSFVVVIKQHECEDHITVAKNIVPVNTLLVSFYYDSKRFQGSAKLISVDSPKGEITVILDSNTRRYTLRRHDVICLKSLTSLVELAQLDLAYIHNPYYLASKVENMPELVE